jgi:hypothetical protein
MPNDGFLAVAGIDASQQRRFTQTEAKEHALALHPDCTHAEVDNGLTGFFQTCWVVSLWRNEEVWLEGDPPKYVEQGYVSRGRGE